MDLLLEHRNRKARPRETLDERTGHLIAHRLDVDAQLDLGLT
jgi:hypothetical protein